MQRPDGAFRVKAVHTRQPIVSARGWAQDLDRLHTWQLAQPADQPLFMAGDFNASQSHPAFRAMLEGLTDAHRATGGGWVRTWPQGRRIPPFVQLDHVLGRGVTAVDAGVTPVRGSDHAAVWATRNSGVTVTSELPSRMPAAARPERAPDAALEALGDASRREILALLAAQNRSVQEIAEQLPISRPAVSRHLRVLKDAGLVAEEAVGTRRIYHLEPEGALAVRDYLERVWGEAAVRFRLLAENTTRRDDG